MSLQDKNVLVGVSGGIAAFKAVELVRELGRRGARVKVAMSASAQRFVGAISFSALTGEAAITDLWDANYAGEVHVALSDWADAIVVAPATAHLLARAAHGLCDDVVLACIACAKSPVLLAPAMHDRMWSRAPNQRNLERLKADGVHFVGPSEGPLANGRIGMGRMAEPAQIANALEQMLAAADDLAGKTVIVSAGPTLEDLDPVRFISNRSSGRMGYAIAQVARERGAHVVLVTGPTSIDLPSGIEVVQVRSALEMQAAIAAELRRADAVIMTAAVADYRPAEARTQKIKKSGDNISIELVKNPDILAELGRRRSGKRPVLVGFAMETQDVAAYGRKKLSDKKVDLIVANDARVAFGGENTQATLVTHAGDDALPPMTKRELAGRILDQVRALLPSGKRIKENRRGRLLRGPRPARHRKGRSPSKA
jgi:phosphopantothenoylcysteine decarboxylase / phosphopantothenate---cysteine ligase